MEKNKPDVLVNLITQRFSNPGKQPKLHLQYPYDGSSEGHQVNFVTVQIDMREVLEMY
jgi:hypothetical protein